MAPLKQTTPMLLADSAIITYAVIGFSLYDETILADSFSKPQFLSNLLYSLCYVLSEWLGI